MSKGHNPKSSIHRLSMKVVDHVVMDDGGLCDHTNLAVSAMVGMTVDTVPVVRRHLEVCPDSQGVRLAYRGGEDLVLVDPLKVHSLKDLQSERAAPLVNSVVSVARTLERQRERNISALVAAEAEARASTNTALADAFGWAANDVRTTGSISPSTEYVLASLGVAIKTP